MDPRIGLTGGFSLSPDGKYVAFATGIHFCLGAFLARDEIRLAIGGVLDRYERLELLDPPAIKGSFNVRGPKGLRVKVH